MRTIAYWLTLLTIILMPWEGFLVLPGIGTASRLMGIVAAVFWLITVLYTAKLRKLTPFHMVAFLFILWNAVTILWSIDPAETFARSITYVQLAIFVLMLWDLFPTRNHVTMGLQAYVLGACVPVASTIFNYLNGVSYSYGRYASTGDNPNTTGILIGLGLPLAWYLAASLGQEHPSRVLRWLNYLYIPFAIFAILLTATRFALVMAVPAMLFGLTLLPRLTWRLRALIFIFVLVTFYQLSSWVPELALQRFATIGNEIQAGDLSDRTVLWNIGVEIWRNNPILGIGSASYNAAVTPIFGRPRSIHNTFVAILAELGVVGLGLFALLLMMAFLQAWRHSAWEFRFWITTLVIWLMGNLVLTWIYYKPTWLILGLLAASASLAGQKEAPKAAPTITTLAPVPARGFPPIPAGMRSAGMRTAGMLAAKVAKTNGTLIVKKP